MRSNNIVLNKIFLFKMSNQEILDCDSEEEEIARIDKTLESLYTPEELAAKAAKSRPIKTIEKVRIVLSEDNNSQNEEKEVDTFYKKYGEQEGYIGRWLLENKELLVQEYDTEYRKEQSAKMFKSNDHMYGGLLCFQSFNNKEFIREVGKELKKFLVNDISNNKYYRKEEDVWILIDEVEASKIFFDFVLNLMDRASIAAETTPSKIFMRSRIREWKNTDATFIMQIMFSHLKLPIAEMIEKGEIIIRDIKKLEAKRSENIDEMVKEFIAKCVKFTGDSGDSFLSGELHQIFSKWSKQNFQEEVAPSPFGKSLKQTKLKSKRSKNGMVYYGIKILDESVGCSKK